MSLSKKIDFAIIFSVNNANPNGDPLNGNRPRTNYDNKGEVTDVCLKRKIRDRLQDEGHQIFVQSDERKKDGMTSLKNRAEADEPIGLGKDAFNAKKTNKDKTADMACKKWFDVRAFGQVFAYKGSEKTEKNKSEFNEDDSDKKSKKETKETGVSIAIRGPVTIQSAFSLDPVEVTSTQITKSVSGEGDGSKKASDTMGMKHRIEGKAIYVTYGAISPQLAERTGFSDKDAETIKEVLPKLFEGDASSARPEGSMKVESVIWWEHNCKSGQYSSAKVHDSLRNSLQSDGSYQLTKLEGLEPEVIPGF